MWVWVCVCTCAHVRAYDEVRSWRARMAMQIIFIFPSVGDGNLGKTLRKGMVKLTSCFEFYY